MDDDEFARLTDARRIVAGSYYRQMIKRASITSTITFYDQPIVDEYFTARLGEWGGYFVDIMPMIFNDRLVLTPMHCLGVYDHGWCFDKGPAAALASFVWDPETQAEPLGYKKRATGQRQAGEKPRSNPIGAQIIQARWGNLLNEVTTD